MEQQKKFYMHKIDNLLNVKKIVTIHYQSLIRRYASKVEQHNFWELIYADKDDITVISDGKQEILRQGEIYFIQPNAPHYVDSGENEPNIFIISFECRSESMQFFRGKKLTVPKNRVYLLQNIMSEARDTFELPDFNPDLNELKLKSRPLLGGEQLIKNSLESLLVYLLRQESDKTPEAFFVSKISSSKELEDEIMKILSERVYGKLSLNELCENLHYGKVKLCTFFKDKTGMSIYQTYLKLKIDEAKKLIRKGKSFSEITVLLCFDSVSSFYSNFKKTSGMTPNEYRNSIQ